MRNFSILFRNSMIVNGIDEEYARKVRIDGSDESGI